MPTFKARNNNAEMSPGVRVSKKTGFTLVEILVTIVILAALAAVSLPNFTRTMSKGARNQAIAYLRTIRTAQKMYYAKWGVYAPTVAGADNIKASIGADVKSKDYDFSINTGNPATTFTATATKVGIPADTLFLTQDGKWDGTGNDKKYAPAS